MATKNEWRAYVVALSIFVLLLAIGTIAGFRSEGWRIEKQKGLVIENPDTGLLESVPARDDAMVIGNAVVIRNPTTGEMVMLTVPGLSADVFSETGRAVADADGIETTWMP